MIPTGKMSKANKTKNKKPKLKSKARNLKEDKIINNYSSSPSGLLTQAGHEGEKNNSLSKIQLVRQKYQDKTT